MAEEEIVNNKESKTDGLGSSGMDYLLFLILILLLVSNRNSFDQYFELFDKQTSKVKNILETFSATAESFRGAVLAPQKLMDKK